MSFDFALPLELLNGASFFVDGLFIAWGVWYLHRESRRRGMTLADWFVRLPPHMHFIIAVIIHDAGVCSRSLLIWWWRRAGAGDFGLVQVSVLALGAALIIVGGLMKIRSVTYPDYGYMPWMMTAYLLAVFLAGSLVIR